MNAPHGIIIFGANGSGKSTLGQELANVLNYKYMDIEDYYFEKSEVPYTVERTYEDCLNLMLEDIEKYNSFVLSAVTGDFGDKISLMYDFAVLMSAPIEIRMERILKREYERHDERILQGGDMYEQHMKFINFVRLRDLSNIDIWAETLSCPVIKVDGIKDYRQMAVDIANQLRKGKAESNKQ